MPVLLIKQKILFIKTPLNNWSRDIFLLFECWLNKSFMSTFFTLSLSLCNHRKTFYGDSKWMHLNDSVFGTCVKVKKHRHTAHLWQTKKSPLVSFTPNQSVIVWKYFCMTPLPTQKAIFENLVQQLIFEVQVVAKIITGILQNNKIKCVL